MSARERRFFPWIVCFLCLLMSGSLWADDRSKARDLVREAEMTFANFVADPNLSWFRQNMKNAQAVFIVPQLLKAGFVFGASGGNGVVLVRDKTSGVWSYPAFYSLGSVTFGLQIGGQVAEVAMLVMSDSGMRALLSTKLQLGVDASVAAGPVGVGAQAATVDILQFSRAKGVYGGLTLEGAFITPRDDLNGGYYGRLVDPVDILIRRGTSNPTADSLRNAVARAAAGR